MTAIFHQLFDVSAYRRRTEQDRAYLIYAIMGFFCVVMLIYATIVRAWGIPTTTESVSLIETLPYRIDSWLYLLTPLVLAAISYGLVRRGRLQLASWGPALMFYVFACVPIILGPDSNFATASSAMTLQLFIVLTGLLNRRTGVLASLLIAISSLMLDPGELSQEILITLVIELIGTAIVAYLFVRLAIINREEGESFATRERLKLADINTQITREASSRADLQDILDLTLALILKNYPQLYHAQVFLLDERGIQAKLRASTGETGQQLLARGHQLAVGSLSVIGQVTLRGEPVIEYAGAANSMHRENELLTETMVEAAFPLFAGDHIIGALDLQSRFADAFIEEDIPTFQSLADSISLVIDNVRQFEKARESVAENTRLIEQARESVKEIDRLNRRLIGSAWSNYLSREQDQIGLNMQFTQNPDEPEREMDRSWSPTLLEAARENYLVNDRHIVAVPLRVRGQVIGAMEFELDENDEVQPEDLELLQEVSERFGLAAENTRLVEDSQRTARREALINEISSRMQSSNNVEATLTETARSLYNTLSASRINIQLGKPDNGNGKQS